MDRRSRAMFPPSAQNKSRRAQPHKRSVSRRRRRRGRPRCSRAQLPSAPPRRAWRALHEGPRVVRVHAVVLGGGRHRRDASSGVAVPVPRPYRCCSAASYRCAMLGSSRKEDVRISIFGAPRGQRGRARTRRTDASSASYLTEARHRNRPRRPAPRWTETESSYKAARYRERRSTASNDNAPSTPAMHAPRRPEQCAAFIE